MQFENIFTIINSWSEHGWLRPLDRAFVYFLKDQAPYGLAISELTLLAGALTSHQLGRGHVCLDLNAALKDPDATLSLPPEGESGEAIPPKPSEIFLGFSPISVKIWESSLLADSYIVGTGAGNTPLGLDNTPLGLDNTPLGLDNTPLGLDNTPLVLDNGRLYLRRYWNYTNQVAADISRRLAISFPFPHLPEPEKLSQRLDELFLLLRSEQERNKTEVHWQSVAAAIAVKSGFTIISGGPGTGKTTTVIQILGLLQGLALEQGQKLRIHLAAPTGKAAARLTESIGNAIGKLAENIKNTLPTEVTTLHRLLGSRPGTRHFIYNQNNKLHIDLLVVDEASMVDLEMMAALLSALPDHARLILLGDKDQLASVEAGFVLGDLCRNAEKECYTDKTINWIEKYTGYTIFPTTEFNSPFRNPSLLDQNIVVLRKSHRFDQNSGIGALARAVNSGDPVKTEEILTKAMFRKKKSGQELFTKKLITKELITKELSEGKLTEKEFNDIYHISINSTDDKPFADLVLDSGYRNYLKMISDKGNDPEDEWICKVLNEFARFQILTPLRKGIWGVEGLNKRIATILHKEGLISATNGWYQGRPVMVLGNDYSLGLMNGDIGIVLTVKGSMKVVFPMQDNSLKKVLPSRLNDVETVYAMTVHKSQGSEFDHTAMVLPDKMNPVLTRELIYTGITRAKSCFTLVTPKINLLGESVKRRTHRASGLGDILD